MVTSSLSSDGREESNYSWDVFLCHNSSDKARVQRLAEALEGRGLKVWFDQTAIRGSSSIPLKVEDGLEGSRTVVLCLSPAFLASEWTAHERASFQHQDPANTRGSFLLLEFKTCTLPRGLNHFKRLDFKRHSDRRIDEIIEALNFAVPAPKPPPGPVGVLLDDSNASARRGEYSEALELAERALDVALAVDPRTPEASRDIARARTACSMALLDMEGDVERAWELADFASDPTALDGYPELLFDALVAKAEAAGFTGRVQAMQAAVLAGQQVADGEEHERALLQLRARLALITGAPDEAAKLYEEAVQSFGGFLNRNPDPEAAIWARRGVGTCLHNRAMALRSSGDLVGATSAFAKAANWHEKAGSQIDESVSRRFLARCHFDDQQWLVGFRELDRAQTLAEAANFPHGVIECLELRARALATTNRLDQARPVLLEALALGESAASADENRRFHQMLATLEEGAGELDAAREHLNAAGILAEQSGDPLALADVVHQLDRLGNERRSAGPAPAEVLEVLHRRLRETEGPGRAAYTMQQLGGVYRSHGELDKARDWHGRAHDAAMAINDRPLAASALIGMADVAIVRNDDAAADALLKRALVLVEHLPAWDVRASLGYFSGRLKVRSGDHRLGRVILRETLTLATEHHIEELVPEIERLLDDVEDWLEFRKAPSRSFEELGDELAGLEEWYPEARRQLRQLWYYWRGDELMKNIMSYSGSKALIVLSDADEVHRLTAELACLVELTTFVAEDSFADASKQVQLVPFPETLVMPYLNIVSANRNDE